MAQSHLVFAILYTGLPWLAQVVENLAAVQEMQVRSLGREDPLEKEMDTHSSILAWRILNGQKGLAGYSPRGCKELNSAEFHSLYSFLCPPAQTEDMSGECLKLLLWWKGLPAAG